jgi:ribosomal protein L37AE/L43A
MPSKIIHRTGLIPPSFGPMSTWCGRKVPIESTGHVNIRGRKLCKVCERIVASKKRLGIWPWSKRRAATKGGA